MATASPFNTLKYAKRLEAAKFSPEQAEVQSEVLAEVLEERDKVLADVQSQMQAFASDRRRDAEQMVSKGDLRELKTELKGDIALVRKDVDLVRKDVDLVRKDMEALGNKLVIRLTVVMGALIGLALAAQRYLPPPAH